MAFYFVEQPFLAMESAFPNPRFCRQQRSPCHHRQQQHRRMPRCTNSMDQLMEEARRQVLLEQNRTSEAFAMQDFLGVMNGIVDGFLKDQQQHQSAVEKNSNSENDSSATPKDDSNQDDQVPKKDDSKENADAECPKQKCSHPGPLKDYFAAIDAIVNAMSKNQHDQKTDDEENSNQSENGSDKNADQRSKDNNDTADEQQHPMKDFLTVMDTIVGTLMNPHHNGNSNSEKKADNKTEVDKLSGGNVDNNVVDQTIKTPAASAASEKDEPKKELAAAAATENEVKEVLKNQVVTPRSSLSSPHQVSQLMTQVHVDENLDRVQIQIEFSGYDLKPEHLDVQVVNNDVLLVKAENDQKQKFERKFKLPAKCQLDNIQPKFKIAAAAENSEQEDDSITQTLNILVPKVDVKKTVNIPINTTTTSTQE